MIERRIGTYVASILLVVLVGSVTAAAFGQEDKPDQVPAVEQPTAVEKSAQSEKPAGEADELSAEQAKLADQFKQLEQAMGRLAEASKGTDPRRAAVLKQAVKESSARDVKVRFESIVKLLEGNSPQYSLAVNNQTELKADLDKILELLLKEDRAGRLESEKRRLERLLKEVGRIIKEERGVKARTEGGDDLKQLDTAQGKIADKTQGLADELAKNPSQSNPSQSQPGDPDPSDRDGKNENESQNENEGQHKNEGESKNKGDNKNEGDSKNKGDSQNKGDNKREGDSQNKGDSEREGDSKNKGDSKSKGNSRSEGKNKSKGDSENEGDRSQEGDSKNKGNSEREGDSKNKGNIKSKGKQESEGDSKSKGDSENEGNIEIDGDSKSQGGGDSQGDSKSKGDAKIKGKKGDDSDPVRKRIQAAQNRMQDAQKKLQEAERKGAADEQRKAIDELEQAKAELEKILRQLREEEIERMLAMLEVRFRKMLEMQIEVYEGTLRLDQVPQEDRDRDHEIESGRQSRKEAEIMREADKALTLLHDEGSSVAFPESIGQMRDDMEQVVVLLAQSQTDTVTQAIEEDIIAALEEMIAALKKAQKEAEERKNKDGKMQDGQQPDQPLVDALAELKMIRALQMRVNKRTETYSKMIQGEQAERPELLKALEKLAERQQRIHAVTRDIHLGKNE